MQTLAIFLLATFCAGGRGLGGGLPVSVRRKGSREADAEHRQDQLGIVQGEFAGA